MALTAKQEKFARLIALDGLSQSDAYRQAYNVGLDTSPATIYDNAHTLAHEHTKIVPRIAALRADTEAKLQDDIQVSVKKIIARLEAIGLADVPLDRVRVRDQVAALDKLAKVLGLYRDADDRDRSRAPVTQIVVMLNHGDRQAVESVALTSRVVEQALEPDTTE